jgi:phosphoadenosine phosphosulfate reductase
VSEIEPATPVVFVDTGQHFQETLDYRDRLVEKLGLTNIVRATPDAPTLAKEDPENFLFASDPDRCCDIRKVAPLAATLDKYEAWITGRKGFQTVDRARLPLFEAEGERVKVNPLVVWSATELLAYIKQHDLPPHPLVAKGFPSIGCLPCTSRVAPGEDPRAGRWRGKNKQECGIHGATLDAGGNI